MITLTPAEKKLARAALGLDGTRRRSYRNRFVAGPTGETHAAWMAMVARGAALRTSGRHPNGTNIYAGGADLFELTQVGAEAALLKGETLDPEDFPPPPQACACESGKTCQWPHCPKTGDGLGHYP